MSRIDTHAFGLWWKLARRWFTNILSPLAKESSLNSMKEELLTAIEEVAEETQIVPVTDEQIEDLFPNENE